MGQSCQSRKVQGEESVTISPTSPKYYDYSHFTDQETVTGRLNNLPKITQLVSEGERIQPGQSGSRVYSYNDCVEGWGVSTQASYKGRHGMTWNLEYRGSVSKTLISY